MDSILIFKDIREPALAYWLKETKRERFHEREGFSGAFECRWQSRFKESDSNDERHYSIFCSMGNWNSNISDILDDKRFDGLTFHTTNAEVLFRFYTRILLIASEILTDFQDILTVFRSTDIDSVKWKGEKDQSRRELNPPENTNSIQHLFDFINTICKHKTRNIHSCNHHLRYFFEDSQEPIPTEDVINFENAADVLDRVRNKSILSLPKQVFIPKLKYILWLIVYGYQVIDSRFESNPAQFEAFCKIYEGKSVSNDESESGIIEVVFPS